MFIEDKWKSFMMVKAKSFLFIARVALLCFGIAMVQGCIDFGQFRTGEETDTEESTDTAIRETETDTDTEDTSDMTSETETGSEVVEDSETAQVTDTETVSETETGSEVVEDSETAQVTDTETVSETETETEVVEDSETAQVTDTETASETETETEVVEDSETAQVTDTETTTGSETESLPDGWRQISVASHSTCAIRDGLLYCWGDNSMGQLGDGNQGSSAHQFEPTIIGAESNWREVSLGLGHACGIRGGELYCWGDNASGKLGVGLAGDEGDANQPTRVGDDENWSHVSVGDVHACAIAEGRLYCWGNNTWGQLGNGKKGSGAEETRPTQIGDADNWSHVSAGGLLTCGLRDGELYCWGYEILENGLTGYQLEPWRIGNESDWTDVSAGQNHACAIRQGALYCWGDNDSGQLGDGSTRLQIRPTRIGIADDWKRVSAGSHYSCGLREDALYCWGYNSYGQVGDGTSETIPTPVPVAADVGWVAVSSGQSHTCGVGEDGSIWCWGSNFSGKLGKGEAGFEEIPDHIAAPGNWSTVSTSFSAHACGIAGGELYCWGQNHKGQVGNGLSGFACHDNKPKSISIEGSWHDVSAGASHTCGLQSGQLYCWGDNSNGQLGNGTSGKWKSVYEPTPIGEFDNWTTISLGGAHSCGLREGELYCWGYNNSGQLGYGESGSGTDKNEPTPIGELDNWTTISLGGAHSCGLREGELYCWGYNYFGQLGSGENGSGTDRNVPTRIGEESDWSMVAAGSRHTCGLRAGALYCWGYNYYGQLGNGTDGNTAKNRPVRIGDDTEWSAVSVGELHTCGIRNGELYCWGSNQYGQLGLGIGTSGPGSWVTAPRLVDNQGCWEDVRCGGSFTCGLRDGELFCWGNNQSGQLGNGHPENGEIVPLEIPFPWS